MVQGAKHVVPAFDQLFRDHSDRVWRTLLRLGVREGDVDDVLQEVFLVVHKQLATFEGRSQISTWIYGICARVASDYRRKAVHRREILGHETADEIDPRTPDDHMAQRDAQRTLDNILAPLDDEKREVFVLFEVEKLSMQEVADALGCPVQTAYYRLYAARKIVDEQVAAMRRGKGKS